MQDQEPARQIEHFFEVTDMEMEQELHNEDVDMILRTPRATVQSLPPPVVEPTPSEERYVVPLDDDPIMEVYNLSFNELWKRIAQA